MKKKLLFFALAGALTSSGAYAAEDTSGMRYTSASEGFYASLRVRFNSGGNDNAGAEVQNSASRIGVRGSSDIGGNSEFFYRYEMGVGTNNGDSVSTRLGYVGLRGNFGQVQAGSFWTQSYNWVHGSTDIANVHSGNFSYTDLLPARTTKSLEYTTPDINGFQGALLARMDNTGTDSAPDKNDVDTYVLSAKYSGHGFTAGVSYTTINDGLDVAKVEFSFGGGSLTADITNDGGKKDKTIYAAALGYARDNWYVNGWYSKDNSAKRKHHRGRYIDPNSSGNTPANQAVILNASRTRDVETVSLAGGVSLDKVALYAVWEQQENVGAVLDREYTYKTLGAQYKFNAQSRVWLEYAGQDLANKPPDEPEERNYFTVGLRHDF